MRQNRHSLLEFPKFNKEVSIRYQREKHCWSFLPLGEFDCLDWSSNNLDDTLGLAKGPCYMI